MGSLYNVDKADLHGSYLSLSLEDDCVFEVAWVNATAVRGNQELPKEVSGSTNRSDFSEQ